MALSREVAAALVLAATPVLLLTGCSKQPEQPATANSALPPGDVVRLDSALDALVPQSARLEKLADGFAFVEGPFWFDAGYLWFSDVRGNVIRQWAPDGKITEIL